jgi:8-amino-7-oxononanoate synthase
VDWEDQLKNLKKGGLERTLRARAPKQDLINFCSNDYLGLAGDPRLAEAAAETAKQYGWGAGSAALISGHTDVHQQLIEDLQGFFKAPAALLFNSGYHANIGCIPALCDEETLIYSDALNHASLIDGCRLSNARTEIYAHKDMNHLEDLLKKTPRSPSWIITETVFSMDGDCAPIDDLIVLAERYHASLYLDEAHAVGVFGEKGQGLLEVDTTRITRHASHILRMGTLGKAFGSYGAFVLASKNIVDFLTNKARSFIYTTALPPAVAAASSKALKIVQREPKRREKLWQHIESFADPLNMNPNSAIFPILIPGNEQVISAKEKLIQEGFFVQAIRFPTVAKGTERLRVTLSSAHDQKDIGHFGLLIKELM